MALLLVIAFLYGSTVSGAVRQIRRRQAEPFPEWNTTHPTTTARDSWLDWYPSSNWNTWNSPSNWETWSGHSTENWSYWKSTTGVINALRIAVPVLIILIFGLIGIGCAICQKRRARREPAQRFPMGNHPVVVPLPHGNLPPPGSYPQGSYPQMAPGYAVDPPAYSYLQEGSNPSFDPGQKPPDYDDVVKYPTEQLGAIRSNQESVSTQYAMDSEGTVPNEGNPGNAITGNTNPAFESAQSDPDSRALQNEAGNRTIRNTTTPL